MQQELTALDLALAEAVENNGRIESRTDTMAVVVRGHRTNHILHLILSICTLGIWIPVWVILARIGGERRDVYQLQSDGTVKVTKPKMVGLLGVLGVRG